MKCKQPHLDANAGGLVCPAAWAAYQQGFAWETDPSGAHGLGRQARQVLREASSQLVRLLGAGAVDASEAQVYFASSGTQALTWMLRFATGLEAVGDKPPHVVTTALEHPGLLQNAQAMAAAGWLQLTIVPPTQRGVVTPEAVAAALRPQTRVVSVTAACHETGVIQPVSAIAGRCRAAMGDAPLFVHTDAVQALGKTEQPWQLQACGADMATIAGHKLGAVGGASALLVAGPVAAEQSALLTAVTRDGMQSPAAALSLVAAVKALMSLEAQREPAAQMSLTAQTRDAFEQQLLAMFGDDGVANSPGGGVQIVGTEAAADSKLATSRLGNTSCVLLRDYEGDQVLMTLDLSGVCVSTGSACASGALEPSPVLLAMGYSAKQAKRAVRFSWLPEHLRLDAPTDEALAVASGRYLAQQVYQAVTA